MNLESLGYEVAMNAPTRYTSRGEEFTKCYIISSHEKLEYMRGFFERYYIGEYIGANICPHYNTYHRLDCFAYCEMGKIKEVYAHTHASRIGVKQMINDTVLQLKYKEKEAA